MDNCTNLMEKDEVEVLISAMHQSDLALVDSTNISTNVLIINQTDENRFCSEKRDFGLVRCISTTDRGLSRSRNKAIQNAQGRYCLLCDDDECLSDDYSKKILTSFNEYKDAGIICFQVKQGKRKYRKNPARIRYIGALRVASWQIVINKDIIQDNNILFDEKFGSGTPIGSGEENIFLYDCLRKGIKIYYVPKCIGIVTHTKSQWFMGFNEDYFINRGIIIRRLMGPVFGLLYCIYFVITKKERYKRTIPPSEAWRNIIIGLKQKQ